jgi:hypothetical protein
LLFYHAQQFFLAEKKPNVFLRRRMFQSLPFFHAMADHPQWNQWISGGLFDFSQQNRNKSYSMLHCRSWRTLHHEPRSYSTKQEPKVASYCSVLEWNKHLPGLVNIQKTMENHHF